MKIERIHRIVGLWMVLLSPFTFHLSPCLAQTSMLSIGVRGGGQSYLPTAAVGANGEIKPGIGGTGALDLRYTYYGQLTDRFGLGVAVGAGIGYGATNMKGKNSDTYSNIDYLGNKMDYTVKSTYLLTDRFAKADVSLLLALSFYHVTLHIGPRFMLPFAASCTTTITQASIDAYYPLYNVHVVDQLITGKLATPYSQPVPSSLPAYHVLMALEIGYEWHLTDQHILGLQAFADIAVWSPKSPMTTALPIDRNDQSPIIRVAPILNANDPVPAVSVNAPSSITKRRYLDFGIRAYYAFSFENTSSRPRRHPHARDTRDHHNRYLWW